MAKFRKYHLIFHFRKDSQNMSILKTLIAVTVNNPDELNQHFQSYLSKNVSFFIVHCSAEMNLKNAYFSE